MLLCHEPSCDQQEKDASECPAGPGQTPTVRGPFAHLPDTLSGFGSCSSNSWCFQKRLATFFLFAHLPASPPHQPGPVSQAQLCDLQASLH